MKFTQFFNAFKNYIISLERAIFLIRADLDNILDDEHIKILSLDDRKLRTNERIEKILKIII